MMKERYKTIGKKDIFQNELNWIANDGIRKFVENRLDELPDYFYACAASSTGKYHPSYALGEGGLVRHTKAAVAIAKDLLGLEMLNRYTTEEKDCAIAALILHDGLKHGITGESYTVADHPVQMANYIEEKYAESGGLTPNQFDTIRSMIQTHMGQWNTDFKTGRAIMPKPESALQRFVHMCDYIASRKYLEVNFDAIRYGEARP